MIIVTISRLALVVIGLEVRKLLKKVLLSTSIWGRLEAISAEIKDLASEWWVWARVLSSWVSSTLQASCLEWSDSSLSCSLSTLKKSFGDWFKL